MNKFIIPQLFTFGSELFIVSTQFIVNKSCTYYAHPPQIQRFQFMFNLTYFIGIFSF